MEAEEEPDFEREDPPEVQKPQTDAKKEDDAKADEVREQVIEEPP